MRKPKFKVGDKVVVWRRSQNWWVSGMDDSVLNKSFVIANVERTEYTKALFYVIINEYNSFGYCVTGDCLKLVD